MKDFNNNDIAVGDAAIFCTYKTNNCSFDFGTVQEIYVNPNGIEACKILAADGRIVNSIYSNCICLK